MTRFRTGGIVSPGRAYVLREGECIMHISDEGLVSGSVNRAQLIAAFDAATDDDVKANLERVGAENGMYVEDGKLVDPSEAQPEPDEEAQVEADEPDNDEPPRGGAGSGRDEWAAYAATLGVEVTEDMNRDDIVAAVDLSRE